MSLDNAGRSTRSSSSSPATSSQAAKERRTAVWVSYDDFCQRCKEVGVKETPRTIATKLLKPLQAACLEKNMPDLSALIIQKPKARSDFGNLLRPSDGWWEPYVARGETDRRRRPLLVQAVPGRPRLSPTGPRPRSSEAPSDAVHRRPTGIDDHDGRPGRAPRPADPTAAIYDRPSALGRLHGHDRRPDPGGLRTVCTRDRGSANTSTGSSTCPRP